MKKAIIPFCLTIATSIPIATVISCGQNKPYETPIDKQMEGKLLNLTNEMWEYSSLNANIKRIDVNFKFLSDYDISEWCFKRNADDTWNNSFRKVAIQMWNYLKFNITTWTDGELIAFINKAPSNLYEIEPISQITYKDIISKHMNASKEFWNEKMHEFFKIIDRKSESVLKNGNKFELKEGIERESPVVKEFIL